MRWMTARAPARQGEGGARREEGGAPPTQSASTSAGVPKFTAACQGRWCSEEKPVQLLRSIANVLREEA